MKFALCLYKHFPFSGLSRDMLRIVDECRRRGHEVEIFTREWQGQAPQDLPVHLVASRGITNHSRCAAFHRRLARMLASRHFDGVVGFNKMPGLDVYYAADDCYVERAARLRSPVYLLTPRYRHLAAFERAVFGPESGTSVMLIAEREKTAFQEYYGTTNDRFHLLPPTLDRNRRLPLRSPEATTRIRLELGVAPDEQLVLLVGSGFKTKGLDRAIRALATLHPGVRERTHLFVVGQDKAGPFRRMARRYHVDRRVHFLGGRADVPELLRGGDLLIHPAYNEAGGTILLEAITSGLPVLATDICGYADHVRQADAGIVLSSPFRQEELDRAFATMLNSPQRAQWSRNGLAYGANPDLYTMPERAVDIIEECARQRRNGEARRGLADNGVLVYLRDDLRAVLGPDTGFEQIMRIGGRLYREAPGRRTLQFTRGNRGYFLKTHTGVGWREILKNLAYVRLPVLGAMNEWHGIHRLQRLNIDTMEVAGFGTTRGSPARRRSFIITDELTDTVSLEDFCGRWGRVPPRRPHEVRFKRWLIARVAEIARAMHTNGANHRDFYLCHFLLRAAGPPDAPLPEGSRVHLIDLHRVQLRRHTPSRWLVKDIAGLYYSSMDIGLTRRDLYRFMRTYRSRPLRDLLADDGRFWRRVNVRAHRLYVGERRKAARRQGESAPRVLPLRTGGFGTPLAGSRARPEA